MTEPEQEEVRVARQMSDVELDVYNKAMVLFIDTTRKDIAMLQARADAQAESIGSLIEGVEKLTDLFEKILGKLEKVELHPSGNPIFKEIDYVKNRVQHLERIHVGEIE